MYVHNQGFSTSIGSVKELEWRLPFDIEDINISDVTLIYHRHFRNTFTESRINKTGDIDTNPLCKRTYAISKHIPETKQINNARHRNAITKLWWNQVPCRKPFQHVFSVSSTEWLGPKYTIDCQLCVLLEMERIMKRLKWELKWWLTSLHG